MNLTNLFELFIGKYTTSIFRENVFPIASWALIVCPLLLSLFYYIVLNRGRGSASFSRTKHWALILLLTVLIVGGISYYLGHINKAFPVTPKYASYLFSFTLSNSLLAAVVYFAFSLLFKLGSTQARRTPF